MRTRTVEIDQQTYEQLLGLAGPGKPVEAGIERLLGREPRHVRMGMLLPYIKAGDFEPGDELQFIRPRIGQRWTLYIDELGRIQLPDFAVYTSPSGAAFALTGVPSSGPYASWLHVPSSRTLAWWRDEHRRRTKTVAPFERPQHSDSYLRDPFGTRTESDISPK